MNNKTIPKENCPFCLAEKQGIAFASAKSFLAIYNIAPILAGHSLIIPRMHIKSLRSLSDEIISEFFLFARKVTDFLLDFYKADAFDWSLQDNEAAGQTIPHLHLHIIVRHPSDLQDPGDWYSLLDGQRKNGSAERPVLDKAEYFQMIELLKVAYTKREKEALRNL